jgi:hypothetical protein
MKISSPSDSGITGRLWTRSVLTGLLASTSCGVALVFTGCGSSANEVSGTYHQAVHGQDVTLEFQSGKVTSSAMGQSIHGTYEVKGDRVVLHLSGKDLPLKINDDGSLVAPALGTFKKN